MTQHTSQDIGTVVGACHVQGVYHEDSAIRKDGREQEEREHLCAAPPVAGNCDVFNTL